MIVPVGKSFVYIPHHSSSSRVHLSGTEAVLATFIVVFIVLWICYIAIVFIKRSSGDYENRNQFMLSLFIPFLDCIKFVIECFKKP